MGVLEVFAIWTTCLIILSSAVEFTDEQTGLRATGNYDYYNDQKPSQTEENNAGASPFKNPNAVPPTPKLSLGSKYPVQTEFPQTPDERQYDYEYDTNNQISPQNYNKYSNSPLKNPPSNYPSLSENSPYPPEVYPNIPRNYPPNNYPSNINQTDSNAPKVYNYNYDKVDDSDPNHITAVHSEAHQSSIRRDNSDEPQLPTGPQGGPTDHPFGSYKPNGFTPPMQRYPSTGNNQNVDYEQYPNPNSNPNYHAIQSDTPIFPRRPGQFNNPFYSQGDGASHDFSGFNSNPNFHQFLQKFRFYPRTANRW